jgi:two-component system, response regulator PdtaR
MEEMKSEKIRVLIVDDSPFSCQLIADSLDPLQFDVVGFANDFQSALESYRTYRPDVITMDIVMPEMDGLEVTKRIVAEEPEAKVVVISSMKDDDLMELGKKNGATAFLQKPFESPELMATLRSIHKRNVEDDVFRNHYPEDFIASCMLFMQRFVKDIDFEPIMHGPRLPASGVVALVGITGKFSGRMSFDLSPSTAKDFATRLLKQEPESTEQIYDVIAEFANIVAGNASSRLNKEFRGACLRVSPPAIFSGNQFSIASPHVDVYAWDITTPYGKIRLSVGFKKAGI